MAATDIAATYLRFAEQEAAGRSPLYEALAFGVAGDPETLDFLATLPTGKQQPNLLFAALRHLFGTPKDWAEARCRLAAEGEAVRGVMLTRATQTNEPARCAVLLPLLAALPQPLALIEVGASAGLCLLPDRYGYDYGAVKLLPPESGADVPVFRCDVRGPVPLPSALPQVVWRRGLDLNPIDPADPEQAAWLETLVWPEQAGRLANLRKALAIAVADGPPVMAGDLRTDLVRLAGEAPKDATLVIFHTAVLAYLESQGEREAFAEAVQSLDAVWLSNESPRVFPAALRNLEALPPHGRFVLSRNGVPQAWTDPHGATIDWLAA